ncbi:glycosylphosphatidylinositol-anchored lipid protein transfer 15 [Hibiscus trionum]|uniref:Glycosylphosphatidylinositol-anchored lipid protein transfer 15 n=1 Tax=Hibiscus trionum TaxID=183268 RepID=A0A9W7JCB0_HIBTR|nr:glycosylphosphatidylinositol-anchored lipid protein transfer 15 [Hibiscus trionum]
MASRGLDMGMGLVLVAMLWAGTNAQSCTSALTSLVPCLNYITGNMSTPSSTCCSQLRTRGFVGNYHKPDSGHATPWCLSGATPPVSQCNGGTPGTPSAASPAGSPSDSSGETPEGATSPSESDIPSGTGSKTVPSIDGGSSDASISKASLVLVLFLVSIAFVTKF